ncbi:unnamed protein product [Aphanomyces euteiches]
MRYREHLDLVLNDITFTVNGGEKIGICGRTDSGKSSLMSALFRMVPSATGSMFNHQRDIKDEKQNSTTESNNVGNSVMSNPSNERRSEEMDM